MPWRIDMPSATRPVVTVTSWLAAPGGSKGRPRSSPVPESTTTGDGAYQGQRAFPGMCDWQGSGEVSLGFRVQSSGHATVRSPGWLWAPSGVVHVAPPSSAVDRSGGDSPFAPSQAEGGWATWGSFVVTSSDAVYAVASVKAAKPAAAWLSLTRETS